MQTLRLRLGGACQIRGTKLQETHDGPTLLCLNRDELTDSSLPHIKGGCFCSTIQFLASPFDISTTQCLMNLLKYDYTAARCFSGLNSHSRSNTPILSKLKSNTDPLQAIRHEVSSSETEQCIHNILYKLGFHYPDTFQPILDES